MVIVADGNIFRFGQIDSGSVKLKNLDSVDPCYCAVRMTTGGLSSRGVGEGERKKRGETK